MTTAITYDPSDTGEIPPPHITDPATEIIPGTPTLPFYADATAQLHPGERPILDNRPVMITTDRPTTLAETALDPRDNPPMPVPQPQPPQKRLAPAVLREPGDPGRHRRSAPYWTGVLLGAGGLLLLTLALVGVSALLGVPW